MVRFRSPAPILFKTILYGKIPERPNGSDCKSDVYDFGGSNPPLPTSTESGTKSVILPRFSMIIAVFYYFFKLLKLSSFSRKIDSPPQFSPKLKMPFLHSPRPCAGSFRYKKLSAHGESKKIRKRLDNPLPVDYNVSEQGRNRCRRLAYVQQFSKTARTSTSRAVYFFMRIVTVSFETVTELIAPFWIISNKNKITPLLICITSSFVGSANRHGSPRSLPPFQTARLLYHTRTSPSIEFTRQGSERRPRKTKLDGESGTLLHCIESHVSSAGAETGTLSNARLAGAHARTGRVI